MNPKSLRDASAEAISLHQGGDERLDVVDPGAVVEIAKSFGAGFSGAKFEVHEIELVGEIGMSVAQIFAHAHHGLIQSKARFDTYYGEIEGIGHGDADARLASIDLAFQEETRNEETEPGHADQQRRGF